MKYKVGDKVQIKSLDWYNENKDEDGYVDGGRFFFDKEMTKFCGKVLKIVSVLKESYYMDDGYCNIDWTDEMIEGLVEEEVLLNIDDFQDDNEIIDIIDEYVHRLKDNECQINLPEGYQFKDENGNVINATKIVLEKKKRKYPKTYEECCKILNIPVNGDIVYAGNWVYGGEYLDKHLGKLRNFQKLLICLDAYWKLYGEEMGLGKPWKPDYDSLKTKYTIVVVENKVVKLHTLSQNHILTFPTEAMRDAFYENFKELIESCKELL